MEVEAENSEASPQIASRRLESRQVGRAAGSRSQDSDNGPLSGTFLSLHGFQGLDAILGKRFTGVNFIIAGIAMYSRVEGLL